MGEEGRGRETRPGKRHRREERCYGYIHFFISLPICITERVCYSCSCSCTLLPVGVDCFPWNYHYLRYVQSNWELVQIIFQIALLRMYMHV